MVIKIKTNKERSLCNVCAKELDKFDLLQDISIHKKIGYGSIYDGEELTLRICCSCLDELIKRCKINPFKS